MLSIFLLKFDFCIRIQSFWNIETWREDACFSVLLFYHLLYSLQFIMPIFVLRMEHQPILVNIFFFMCLIFYIRHSSNNEWRPSKPLDLIYFILFSWIAYKCIEKEGSSYLNPYLRIPNFFNSSVKSPMRTLNLWLFLNFFSGAL